MHLTLRRVVEKFCGGVCCIRDGVGWVLFLRWRDGVLDRIEGLASLGSNRLKVHRDISYGLIVLPILDFVWECRFENYFLSDTISDICRLLRNIVRRQAGC